MIGLLAVYWLSACLNDNFERTHFRECEKQAKIFLIVTQYDFDYTWNIIPYRTAIDELFSKNWDEK